MYNESQKHSPPSLFVEISRRKVPVTTATQQRHAIFCIKIFRLTADNTGAMRRGICFNCLWLRGYAKRNDRKTYPYESVALPTPLVQQQAHLLSFGMHCDSIPFHDLFPMVMMMMRVKLSPLDHQKVQSETLHIQVSTTFEEPVFFSNLNYPRHYHHHCCYHHHHHHCCYCS